MSVTVAIIEDDAPNREIWAEWVDRSPDFKCIAQFGSVEAALPKLPELQPRIVLSDINLPGLSGIEGVRRLKPLLANTQFVMLTVYEDADHIFEALAAGATGYMLKDSKRTQLLEALREVLAGGSPMSANIARKVVQSFQQSVATRTQPAAAAAETENLSPRESEVLDLLAQGLLYKEISEKLGVSMPTVNTYIRRIYEKLQVRSRAQAVARYTTRR
ncbi:MAG TPA: response regulator transcription factor [Verrucomicrobiae bacterium]|nr:response regulator transcription factor [Verrucomicrobiae bacterium]